MLAQKYVVLVRRYWKRNDLAIHSASLVDMISAIIIICPSEQLYGPNNVPKT